MNRPQCVFSAGLLPRGLWQLRRLAATLAILSLPAFSSVGWAISIGPGLNGPFGFDTAPSTADFTTVSLAGDGATFLDATALNTAVQALNAASITTTLPTSPTVNPS